MDRNFYDGDFLDGDEWRFKKNAAFRHVAPKTRLTTDPDGRYIPKDGDVVFGPDGTVHRVGDTPRSRRKNMTTEVVRVSQSQAMERLRAALAEVAGVQSLLNRFGNQEPPIGSVIRWLKRYDARSGELIVEGLREGASADDLQRALRINVSAQNEHVHVAFRAPNGKWYTTAQRGASTFEWDALVREIGDSPCELASEWTEVPAPEKPSEEMMDPTTWARMMFGKKDDETPVTPSDENKS